MGLLDNGLKGNLLSGLAIGIGAVVVAPIVIPILSSAVKPVAKAVIKESLILFEKGKETFAEAKEAVEDLVAEAKSEMEMEASGTPAEELAGAAAPAVYAEEMKPEKVSPKRRRKSS